MISYSSSPSARGTFNNLAISPLDSYVDLTIVPSFFIKYTHTFLEIVRSNSNPCVASLISFSTSSKDSILLVKNNLFL